MSAVRIAGAAFIICGSVFFGASELAALKRRVRVLEALISALGIMRGEICSRLTPMADILEMLSRETEEPIRGLFRRIYDGMQELGERSFYEIWSDAVRAVPMGLTEREERVLCELGNSLGRYDIQLQAASLSRTAARFEDFLREAEEARRRDGRVHLLFPIAAGVSVVMILI